MACFYAVNIILGEDMRKGKKERRKVRRRRPLNEEEFRRLIEHGKVTEEDRRKWQERRKTK